MNLLSKIRVVYYRWRRRVRNQQYQSGWDWAITAYTEGGWSLDEIEIQAEPFGDEPISPFDRGAQDAVNHLREQQEPTNTTGEIDTNANGDPVGVPYFIDPEKEKRTREVEVEMGFRNPRRELIDRRCYSFKNRHPRWVKVGENRET